MLLAQLAEVALEGSEVEYVVNRLKAYGMIKGDASESLKERIIKARLYRSEVNGGSVADTGRVVLNDMEKGALSSLIDVIKSSNDPKVIQSGIFDTARRNGIEPKEFFRLLYTILIGSDHGPRLGTYIVDVGREKVISILSRYL
jgi:lysyl-tRNA synthetase, class I